MDRNPLSASARRSNIEKAIAFLNSDGANLGTDSTKGKVYIRIKVHTDRAITSNAHTHKRQK